MHTAVKKKKKRFAKYDLGKQHYTAMTFPRKTLLFKKFKILIL